MTKLKWILMSIAILTAVGGAVASAKSAVCESFPQYVRYAGMYMYAGVEGQDYYCYPSAGVCTYWLPNPPNGYVPCKTGAYVFIW